MSISPTTALDRARRKAYIRLLPLLFLSYAIAYVDRINVSLASWKCPRIFPALTRKCDRLRCRCILHRLLPAGDSRHSARRKMERRKWISRIMISWGICGRTDGFCKDAPSVLRCAISARSGRSGLFPGVIVYLTHWFPARDRARALAWFFIATPVAQFVSPKLSYFLLRIGTTETFGNVAVHHPALWECRVGNGCTSSGAFRR